MSDTIYLRLICDGIVAYESYQGWIEISTELKKELDDFGIKHIYVYDETIQSYIPMFIHANRLDHKSVNALCHHLYVKLSKQDAIMFKLRN